MPRAPSPEGHYENFPVASWLCPPRIRPAVLAIYRFARAADDIADEGDAPAHERLALLAHFGVELRRAAERAHGEHAAASFDPEWRDIFEPLTDAIRRFDLPVRHLAALLSAFEQDVRKTAAGAGYADEAELLDYCGRSANPVGRLLLHLYGVADPRAQAASDAVCTGLQLANFWQDLSVDLPRGRRYLPSDALLAHGLDPARADTWPSHPNAPILIALQTRNTWALLRFGSKIVHAVPGRAGWELRLVVQGGLAIARKVERLGARAFRERPTLGAADLPGLLWRALRM